MAIKNFKFRKAKIMGDISDAGVKKAEKVLRIEEKDKQEVIVKMTVGEQKNKILRLIVLGEPLDSACQIIGINKLTLLNWLAKDEGFKEQYNNAKRGLNELIALRAKQKLVDLIEEGNASSVQFALRNLDVDFQPKETKEVVIKDENYLPIEHETSKLPIYHDGAEGSLIVSEEDVING